MIAVVVAGGTPIALKDMLVAKKLETELIEANRLYHSGETSPLTDAEYDEKIEELRLLKPQSTLFSAVGAAPSGAKIYKHAYPVGSQEKLKTFEELEAWCDKVEALDRSPTIPFIVQWKLDGITAVLTYKDGKLVRALTRGDGEQGEDITRNVKLMGNVKELLPGFTGVLRGEIVLPISKFEKHFKPLGFKNPRNTVAGKTRDEKAEAKMLYSLEIIYFDVLPPMETEEGAMKFLEAHDLDHVDYEIVNDKTQVWDAFHGFERRRPDYDIDCDGVVVKANNTAVQAKLGISSDMRPHGQKCLKFQAAGAITTILDVVHTVGHTGEIYPTAKVEPVDVCGVTISSCTLHNYEEVARLGAKIGCRVRIIRAGDVIPKIVSVDTDPEQDTKPINPPKKCPACRSPTVKEGQHIFCRNEDCSGQKLRRIKTWVKKRDIKYWGDEVLQCLFEAKMIDDPYDLYFLQQVDVRALKMSGRVVGGAADRMFDELQKSKTCTLSDFIGSLGLEHLGRREAELMMIGCDLETVEDFLALTEERLAATAGYGDVSAKQIITSLKKGAPLIRRMLEVITITEEEKPVVANKTKTLATGKTFCFTGALPSGATRVEAEADLMRAGGIPMDSVKGNLDYLVIADPNSQSAKAKKARSYGVQLINELQFRGLLLKGP